MALKAKIHEDLKDALLKKLDTEVSVLRLLNSAILNKEKEKRYRISKEKPHLSHSELDKECCLNDEEVMEVVISEAKKRKEAIFEFEKGKRYDLVERERKELSILQKYLPAQLSEEEVKKIIKETIEKTGAKDLKDMGKVMSYAMSKLKGRAEGKLVSEITIKMLTGE